MKKKASLCRRGMAGALAGAMLAASLTGCAGGIENIMSMVSDYLPAVVPGQTVSENSKWVNSSIDGSLVEDTPTNKKDDFYTAVNREWNLATELTDDTPMVGPFYDGQSNLHDRMASILLGTPDDEADLNNELPGLSAAQVSHDLDLVQTLAAMAEDDTAREAAGVEPARPYIDAVKNIGTLDEMTAFLCNTDGTNIALNYLVPFDVTVPYTERTAYTVTVEDTPKLSLGNDASYRQLGLAGIQYKSLTFKKANYLLGRLGWSEAEIETTLYDCLNLEQKLAHSLYDTSEMTESDAPKLFAMQDNKCTKQDLIEMQGNYPLVETLESCGMADTDHYIVKEPDYLRAVGKLYTEANLEQIKAYFLVHSIDTLLPLLDKESVTVASDIGHQTPEDKTEPDTPDVPDDGDGTPAPDAATPETAATEDPAVTQAMETMNSYIAPYLSAPLQQVYVARYCTEEQKARMQEMIDSILDVYHTMLQSEEWMSEETCTKALEKLDLMVVRNLYPDEFVDYSELKIDDAENLVEAVAAIRRFARLEQNSLIDQPITANHWDLSERTTTMVNAYYMPSENSINLMAGLFSSDFFYDDTMSDETLLARTGTIIGHEISHAFDSTGCEYDSAGYRAGWWTTADYDSYKLRTGHLIKDYNTQYLAPGMPSSSYGDKVNGEAVADMAGVKVALLVAKENPNFDYDAFFTSYAQMWRSKYKFPLVMSLMTDEHPLDFLRANKTLQQFDEFMTTYNITPDDGMYLAPENRITVW